LESGCSDQSDHGQKIQEASSLRIPNRSPPRSRARPRQVSSPPIPNRARARPRFLRHQQDDDDYEDEQEARASFLPNRTRRRAWRVAANTSPSTPHRAHPGSEIGKRGASKRSRALQGLRGPGSAFEEIEDGVRNEPAPRCKDVRVTGAMLLAPEKPKRLDQMKVKLGPRHGDAKNPAFFLDLFRATRCHIGG
jgi:hypothetical protein